MFAAGNGGVVKDSCAFNGYVNNIYTIAITGVRSNGSIPVFGERCAAIMAVTYTKDILEQSNKVVRRQTTSFNNNFNRVARHFAATMFFHKTDY